MRLWTIQPMSVYNLIISEGHYICDDKKSHFLQERRFRRAYDWLVGKMTEIIGPAPEKVTYPVWAHLEKPDLSDYVDDYETETQVCIEFEIDPKDVVFTKHDYWSNCALNFGPYIIANSIEEFDAKYDAIEALPWPEQKKAIYDSWDNIIVPFEKVNKPYTQATFWILKSSQIKEVTFFEVKRSHQAA